MVMTSPRGAWFTSGMVGLAEIRADHRHRSFQRDAGSHSGRGLQLRESPAVHRTERTALEQRRLGETVSVPDLRYSQSIFVVRSPEALYDMISDVTRMGEWSPNLQGVLVD